MKVAKWNPGRQALGHEATQIGAKGFRSSQQFGHDEARSNDVIQGRFYQRNVDRHGRFHRPRDDRRERIFVFFVFLVAIPPVSPPRSFVKFVSPLPVFPEAAPLINLS